MPLREPLKAVHDALVRAHDHLLAVALQGKVKTNNHEQGKRVCMQQLGHKARHACQCLNASHKTGNME